MPFGQLESTPSRNQSHVTKKQQQDDSIVRSAGRITSKHTHQAVLGLHGLIKATQGERRLINSSYDWNLVLGHLPILIAQRPLGGSQIIHCALRYITALY